MRNLLTRVAKSAQDFVASLVGSIFAQPDPASLHVQHLRVVGQLERGFPEAAELLADAGPEILAFAAFPKEHWKRIRWNNPQVRLNREVGVMLPTKFRDGSVPASYENLRVLEEAPRILPPGVETVPGRADSASAPMPWTGRADARRLGNGPRSRRPQ